MGARADRPPARAAAERLRRRAAARGTRAPRRPRLGAGRAACPGGGPARATDPEPGEPRAGRLAPQRRRRARRRRAAQPGLVLESVRGLAGADPAGGGSTCGARRDRIRVLPARDLRAARGPAGAHLGRSRRGRRGVHAHGQDDRAAAAPLRAVRRVRDRAQEPRRARARRPGARGGRGRRGRGRGRAPAVRGRAGPRGAHAARPRRRRRAAGALRRRAGVRAAVAARGLRADRAGGDGLRHAGRRRARGRAAGDLRRRRPARRARAGGAARRAGRPARPTTPSGERLRAAGLARAAAFSWARTAGEVDELLQRLSR